MSVITACVPSIKRFLADWAAGMSAATISDPFEFEHSAGKSGSQSDPQGSNLGSKIASRFGLGSKSHATSTSRSWAEGSRSAGPQHEAKIHGRRVQTGSDEADTSDSVKGLTDGVIMHTIDYKVEYEERQGGGGHGGGMYRNRSSSSSMHGAEREHGYEIARGM
jgi:hypothetical protein